MIHFSIDDVIGCFRYLKENQSKIGSIFYLRLFSFARFLHDTYGIKVNLYCMYTDGKFMLSEMPNKWRQEFRENSDWLKLGFHSFDGSSNYSAISKENFSLEYDYVLKELIRITGSENSIAKIIRLHLFAGNKSALSILSGKGIHGLLCADDDRGSYYLSQEIENSMKKTGTYYDSETELTFYPTHIRIENFTELSEDEQNLGKISIFTHERYFNDDLMRNRIVNIMERLKSSNFYL